MPPKLDKKQLAVVIAAVIASVAAVVEHRNEHYNQPTGVRDRSDNNVERGKRWKEECLRDPEQLYAETRLRPEAFESLVASLRSHKLVADTNMATVEEKLLTFLYICAQGESWRNTKNRYGHSLATISHHFHEVLDGVIRLYTEVVKPPASSDNVPDRIRDDPQRGPAFKDCVGALGCSHFKLHVPAGQKRRYWNRYGYLSQNVLAAVDFDMNFVYVLCGWEGEADGDQVVKDAQRRGFEAPAGRYFLADTGYANSELLLCPYRGVPYELREITQDTPDPEDRWESLNYHHASLRNVVERTLAVFKRRWRIFDRPHEFSTMTQIKLLYALVAVHNHINRHYSVDEDLEELDPYPGEELELEQREDENLDNIGVFEGDMNERREEIADTLWRNYGEATGSI